MELGSQIKKYRNELALSQDALAEKVYVSRQTISNWENGKSYPDVNSLILLSEVFQTSLDDLIKGDVEVMREQVRSEDIRAFKRLSIWRQQRFSLLSLSRRRKSNLIFRLIERSSLFQKENGSMKLKRIGKTENGPIKKYCWLWDPVLSH